jgi:hypothetical protein
MGDLLARVNSSGAAADPPALSRELALPGVPATIKAALAL